MPSIATGYTLGLLRGCTSVQDMSSKGLLPVGRHHTCRLLARDPAPHQHALARRLPPAPPGFFLAGDLVTIQHEGPRIEGVGRHYSSASKGMFWGHTFTSSALVAPGEDPYLLRTDPFPDARMATRQYPKFTPSEALLTIAGDLVLAGYKLAGVLADAQFSGRLTLRTLKVLRVPFVMRFRTNGKVMFDAQMVRVRELAEKFRPGRARWYPRLQRYVKRLSVVVPEVGEADLLLVWKWQRSGWYLTALVSTLSGGVQAVMLAWSSRWSLEVSHRTRKQNLGLGRCQCRAFASHLRHADLVIDAFNRVRAERAHRPGLTWRAAQRVAAERLERSVVTGANSIVA